MHSIGHVRLSLQDPPISLRILLSSPPSMLDAFDRREFMEIGASGMGALATGSVRWNAVPDRTSLQVSAFVKTVKPASLGRLECAVNRIALSLDPPQGDIHVLNEAADGFFRAATSGELPADAVPQGCRLLRAGHDRVQELWATGRYARIDHCSIQLNQQLRAVMDRQSVQPSASTTQEEFVAQTSRQTPYERRMELLKMLGIHA